MSTLTPANLPSNQQRRGRGNATAQKGPGAHNRRFKTKKPGNNKEPPVYALRVDLASVLWQPDNDVERCPQCHKEFGFFRRMHHCRACGLIFCDDHCQEDDDHDNERVCVPCMAALQELNDWAKQEFADRLRRAQEAQNLLDDFAQFDVVQDSRNKILDEEVDARLYLMDNMRESQRAIAADIRDKISSVVGNVAQMERRRTRPIYGLRGGVLRLRVQRARNLQPVKKSANMSCNPHVVVQVGSDRQRSEAILRERCCLSSHGRSSVCRVSNDSSSVANDFSFGELFVFDVDNDRDGVIVSIVDDISIPGVPVLLGLAYLNIRQMNLIEEEVDWKVFDACCPWTSKNIVAHSKRKQRNAAARNRDDYGGVLSASGGVFDADDGGKNNNNNHHQQQQHQSQDDFYDEETERIRRQIHHSEDAALLLSPGGEFVPYAKLGSRVRLSSAASALLNKNNNNKKDSSSTSKNNSTNIHPAADEEMKDFNNNTSPSPSSPTSALLNDPTGPINVMRDKTKDDFHRFMERGSANRALCDFDGHALTSAQVTISWSFHPYKLDPRVSRQLANSVLCDGCKERDAPGYCLCGDQEKEELDDEFVKRRLRQVGGEVHAIEMSLRQKYTQIVGTKMESSSPLFATKGGKHVTASEPIDFGQTRVQVLRPQKRDKVETCCC